MPEYCRAVNETCPQNVLREVMAKTFQSVAQTLRKQFEEVSCKHSLKKKEHALNLNFNGLRDACKSNDRDISSQQSE